MATLYQITLFDLIGRVPGPVVLPSAEDVVYSPVGATVTWRDPLADYREVLIALGANARYEQFRLSNNQFVVWSPDPNAGPMSVEIQESDLWNGAIRSRTIKCVLQMPTYRYTPVGDTASVVLLFCDCWVNAAGLRDCGEVRLYNRNQD